MELFFASEINLFEIKKDSVKIEFIKKINDKKTKSKNHSKRI